ncbi:RHS repeat-associated core domain-containing protein [Actinotignum sp. GS-2025b]|uniref:RHS repeat-associated core domain-containing protein n=1 Tax=Actinotignum sp. GS-2025b TaxID=3427275 RepID=UPI003F48A13F
MDDLGNLRSITMPDGDEFTFVFDALSRLREVADPLGHAWKFEYDAVGDLSTVIDPAGVTTRTVTDSKERTATSVDSHGHGAVVQFDEFGRPVASYDTAKNASVVTYDIRGNVTEMLDAEGALTTLDYDAAGRVVRMTSSGGKVTEYTYGPSGRLDELTTPEGVTRFEYDADGRVVATVNTAGEHSTFEYDSCGRLLRARVAGRGTSEFRYDACGRVTYSRDILTGVRYFRYDAAGNLISVRNGLGGITRYEYDVRNRLVRVVDPAGGVTERVYDGVDNLLSVTDPLGRSVALSYDEVGNPVSRTSADGTVTSFEHEDGMVSQARINGREAFRSELDYEDRTLTLTDGEENRHVFTYDRLGRLVSHNSMVAGAARCSTWTYGKDGERTSYTPAGGATYRYGYDAVGNLATITHPDLDTVRFGYDPMGRVTHMVAGEDTHQWAYRDGFVCRHTHTRDGVEETTRVEHDSWGRVISITTGSEKVAYEYGEDGQLTAAISTSGVKKTWEYDEAARIIRFTDGDTVSEYTYDQASQLVERHLTSPQGTSRTVYGYDADGYRVSQTVDGKLARRLRWDASGSLAGITDVVDGRERELTITLDGLGNPVSFGDETRLEWDYASPIPTVGAMNGSPFMSLPGGVMLSGQGMETRSDTSWRAGRGTDPMAPFASPGVVAGLSEHLPEGVDVLGTGALRVGGMEWMGERLYDPATQAFLSPDPLPAPAGTSYQTNPYNYGANNPLALMDPLGLTPATDGFFTRLGRGLDAAFDGIGKALRTGWNWTRDNILKPVGNFLKNAGNWLKGAFNATVNWVKVHWKTVVGVVAVGAGIALLCSGIGAPAGAGLLTVVGYGAAIGAGSGALIGGGSSMISQDLFNHDNFSWGEVIYQTVLGGVSGGIGGGLGAGASHVTTKLLKGVNWVKGQVSHIPQRIKNIGNMFKGKPRVPIKISTDLSRAQGIGVDIVKSVTSDYSKEATNWVGDSLFKDYVETGNFNPNFSEEDLAGRMVTVTGAQFTGGALRIKGVNQIPTSSGLSNAQNLVLQKGGKFLTEFAPKEVKNLEAIRADLVDGDGEFKSASHARRHIKSLAESVKALK